MASGINLPLSLTKQYFLNAFKKIIDNFSSVYDDNRSWIVKLLAHLVVI